MRHECVPHPPRDLLVRPPRTLAVAPLVLLGLLAGPLPGQAAAPARTPAARPPPSRASSPAQPPATPSTSPSPSSRPSTPSTAVRRRPRRPRGPLVVPQQPQRRHPRQRLPALPGPRGLHRRRHGQRRPLRRGRPRRRGAGAVAGPGERGEAEETPAEAVVAAADALDLEAPEDLEVLPGTRSADGNAAVVSDGGISDTPIPTTLGWQPTEDGLRLAYQVVIDDSTDVHLYNATVDAETGELLDVQDWTIEHDEDTLASTLSAGGASRSPRSRTTTTTTTAAPTGATTRWPRGRATRSTRSPRRARTTGPAHGRHGPGRRLRLAVRLARHQRGPRAGVHDDARQQRPRVPRPGQQQPARPGP